MSVSRARPSAHCPSPAGAGDAPRPSDGRWWHEVTGEGCRRPDEVSGGTIIDCSTASSQTSRLTTFSSGNTCAPRGSKTTTREARVPWAIIFWAWTHSLPLVRPSRAFGFTEFPSPPPKRLKSALGVGADSRRLLRLQFAFIGVRSWLPIHWCALASAR